MLDSMQNKARSVSRKRRGWGSKCTVHIAILTAVTLTAVSVARAQISPPIGPDSYRSDAKQLSVSILTGMVKTTVDKIVTDTNAELSRQGKSIRIQALPFRSWSPLRVATQYTNRPNEWFIQISTMIGINVDIPVVADRQIYYPLDLNLTCDRWFTGNGVVKVTAKPGPPSVEGGSIIEDIVHIRDYVDSQVKSHLPQIAAVTQTIPNSQCVTIGHSPNTGTDDKFAFIAWDPPGRRPIGGGTAAVLPRLEVAFTRLKRLRARGNGAVLYNPTENIRLDVFANMTQRQSTVLTLKEDDDIALNIPPIVFNNPLPSSLVVISNVNQEPLGSTQDSAFAAALKSANYSPGTHSLQIPKHYVMRLPVGNSKPVIATVPAYELTYVVKYLTATVVQ